MEKTMLEYGGYLPLETSLPDREYYSEKKGYHVIRLNAARYGIALAAKMCKAERVWIPIYTCNTVPDTLEQKGIPYCQYNIHTDMEPDIREIGENDWIVITNFFGQKGKTFYERMIQKYKRIIFDNTHSFFSEPVPADRVFYVYSPRKFIGVADGAYLIGQDLEAVDLIQDKSGSRSLFLLKSFENGTNDCYQEYLDAMDDLTSSGIRRMSSLTHAILCSADYPEIIARRKKNYAVLVRRFEKINEYRTDPDDDSPIAYPLVISNPSIREKLIRNRIYVPQWWKAILQEPKANEWEKTLSEYLLPLPMDQRYSEEDMEHMASLIEQCIESTVV